MCRSLRSGFLLCVVVSIASCGQGSAGPGFVPPGPPEDAPTLEGIEAVRQDETLDDFEDGDLLAWLPDGEGYWTSDADGEGLSVIEDGSEGERALQVEPGAERVIANLSVEGAALRRHDYSSCTGLELTIRSDGSSATETVLLIDSVVGDSESRGVAAAPVEVTDAWTTVELDWSDFQPTESEPTPTTGGAGGTGGAPSAGSGASGGIDLSDAGGSLDTRHILALSVDALADANLLIDAVRLKDCELLPLNPPLPEPLPLGADAPADSPVATHGQLRVKGSHLYDQNGDLVQLKGVSSMWLNYEITRFAESKEGLRWMRDNWNLDVLRAAMGAGDNDANGPMTNSYTQRPEALRSQVETIIENAVELGVYVIVDWHSHEIHTPEARAFFDDIAARYGQYPNVIYETFNEPTQQPWLTAIKPYHESVVASIRARDPDNVIVLGTRTWSQDVGEAARDPVGGSNLMYTTHFYTCSHPSDWIIGGATRAMDNGVAVFATEWGATKSDGGLDGIVCTDEAIEYLEWMEDESISWTAWRLDACGDSSCLLKPGQSNPDGGWTESDVNGHGPLVIDWLLR